VVVRLLVTADIHSPKYFGRFREAVRGLGRFDGVLIAGDLMEGGSIDGLRVLIDVLRGLSDVVFAVPGNHDIFSVSDNREVLPRARALGFIRWLNDEVVKVPLGGVMFRIVGSEGSLERPTRWQSRNVPGIVDVYRHRVKWLRGVLSSPFPEGLTVLLVHYSPSFRTVVGEDPRVWPMLGVRDLEGVVFGNGVIAVHGHAHEARVRCVRSGGSYIINASFINLWRPIVLEVDGGGVRSVDVDCVEVPRGGKGGGKSILDFMG
jgi:Icc-related predicted phosphoesterase